MPLVEFLRETGFPAPHAEALGHTVDLSVVSTGATQATAYQLIHAVNGVAVTAAGTGVRLPVIATWKPAWCVVVNIGANALLVYPSSGEFIYANGGVNLPITLAAAAGGSGIIFFTGIVPTVGNFWVRAANY